MKKFVILSSAVLVAAGARAQGAEPLRQVQTIPLLGVEGRIDHLSVDTKGQRLFVAALGNNTVEVVDLQAGKRTRSIAGLREPQGVLYAPEFDKLFVANGTDGKCRVFDGRSLELMESVDFKDDADNLRYDRTKKQVYVGYGEGGLGVIDPKDGELLGEVPLDAHPESFQLEHGSTSLTVPERTRRESGPRIFVNVPNARHVAVVDRERRTVVAKWPTADARANFPMTLDEAHRRLFVTCRRPPQVLVFDTTSGKILARVSVVGDADDMFYDSSLRRIYVSGGEGLISVVEQRDSDHYELIGRIPTAPGARTSLFVPEYHRLYLAVPHRGAQRAEIRVYETQR